MSPPLCGRRARPSLPIPLLLSALVPSLLGWATASAEERVRVAASDRYEKGRVHRFVLGGGYRDLWEAPVDLPVLDLAEQGGGLTPSGRFGGLQTAVLGFKGADGRLYTFRGTDKDPSAVLDPLLRETVVRALVQDQMAAQHPGGPLVAGVLSEAAGLLTIRERMVVVPDDPALGEYREEFAGMIGNFYEYPTAAADGRPGFHGATEIIDHEELYARIAKSSEDRADARAFLRARLFDLLIGDFDRHRKQWRWARLPGEPLWQPIPEDRDQAFVRYDGVGQRVMKLYIPILQNYGPDYPWIKGLTLHGWEQDRWLLPALEWEDWQAVVRDLRARITDAVIDRAVSELPPEYEQLDGDRLRADLRSRRDQLEDAARSFYDHLAGEVDIQTTDAAETVRVDWEGDDALRVRVAATGADGVAEPWFDRRFVAGETGDLRIVLRGGADRVSVTGEPGCMNLRILSSAGADSIDDSASGDAIVYVAPGSGARVTSGRGTDIDPRPYTKPPSESGFVDVEDVPPRDWGSDTLVFPALGFEADVGVYLGASLVHTRYGFRRHPWSSRHTLSAAYAFEANQPNLGYNGLFRLENSPWTVGVDLEYSGIEVLRFYGFGNDTNDGNTDRLFRVRNEHTQAALALRRRFADDRIGIAFGPELNFSNTQGSTRLIDQLAPYGEGNFGAIGAFANFRFDTRQTVHDEHPTLALPLHANPAAGYPTSGILFDLTGRIRPPVWDVRDTYGSIEGSLAGFLSAGEGGRAVLGVRVGGTATFGPTPYFDAATIGGGRTFSGDTTIRGFRAQRFAGDHSAYANADLRIWIGRVTILVPGDYGVTGFYDVGRVFEDDPSFGRGSRDRTWHQSGGGGVWWSPLTRTNTVSLTVADSTEETLFYLRLGFHY